MKFFNSWIFLVAMTAIVAFSGGYVVGEYLTKIRWMEVKFPELSIVQIKRMIQKDMSKKMEQTDKKNERLKGYRDIAHFLLDLTYFGGASYAYPYDDSTVPALVTSMYKNELRYFQEEKNQNGITNFPSFLLENLRGYFRAFPLQASHSEDQVLGKVGDDVLLLKQYRELDFEGYERLLTEVNTNAYLSAVLTILERVDRTKDR
ncbi:MAG: hypothetical protein FWG50_08665 [Kiritimatiellaeota bacterium]|nr:hypothetical protein [Kiritimatiellota bacterium]